MRLSQDYYLNKLVETGDFLYSIKVSFFAFMLSIIQLAAHVHTGKKYNADLNL